MADKSLMLKETNKNLNTLLAAKAQALPKDFNQTRFLQNCMTVLQDTKGIENVQPLTVARTLLKGAFLGLDFMNKECYAIPFGQTLQFLTDYKGEIKLAKKYSINPIKDIYAKLVREDDFFEEEIKEGKQVINFKPKSFNNKPIVGAFAIVMFEDGSMLYETMSVEEIEDVRMNFSKAPNSAAWKNAKGEMYKKTVLRRLCKLIELDFDNLEQMATYKDSSDLKTENTDKKAEESPFDNVVEAEFKVDDNFEGSPFEEGDK